MAEFKQQWKQNMHYGGFSDDRFLGIKNSFASAKGIEVRRNPHSLKLARQLKNDDKDEQGNPAIITDFIKSFVTIKSTGTTLACGANGKIYKKKAGQVGWTLIYTFDTGGSAGNNILNCVEYNDYVYFLSVSKLHRLPVTSVDLPSWVATIELSYKSFQQGGLNYRPTLEMNNNLYIGDGRYLSELSSAGVFTYNKLLVFGDEEIVALTYGGSMMRIYASKILNSQALKTLGGHKYYWNGTDASYTEYVEFSEPIHCAISNGGSDYVIAGLEPWLYLASGYEFAKIKKLPFIGQNSRCYLGSNFMSYFDQMLVFPLQYPFADGSAYEGKEGRGVFTYGNFDEKYPDVLNFEYPCSQYEEYDPGSETHPAGYRAYFGAIHNANGVLMVSWAMHATVGDPGVEFGIDVYDKDKFNATGELTSIVHYGSEAASDKFPSELKVAYAKLNPGEKIEIYLAKELGEFGDTPELVVDYNFTEDEGETYPDRNTCHKEKDIALDIADYTFLQTKTVLTAGTNQLTTPEVIETSLGFDVVELAE